MEWSVLLNFDFFRGEGVGGKKSGRSSGVGVVLGLGSG